MAHLPEPTKHVVDAIAIPGGLLGIASHYMPLLNQVLTFCVLVTSLIWGVYRILDMREARRARKAKRL